MNSADDRRHTQVRVRSVNSNITLDVRRSRPYVDSMNAPATEPKVEFVCDRHNTRDPNGPTLFMVDGRWCYCPSATIERGSHSWRRIEPTYRAVLDRSLA